MQEFRHVADSPLSRVSGSHGFGLAEFFGVVISLQDIQCTLCPQIGGPCPLHGLAANDREFAHNTKIHLLSEFAHIVHRHDVQIRSVVPFIR